jgi:hypothetical protein
MNASTGKTSRSLRPFGKEAGVLLCHAERRSLSLRAILRRIAMPCLAGVALVASAPAMADTAACHRTSLTAEDLMQWPAWGIGQRMPVSRQLLMEESENSQGYMAISPQSYDGDVVLSFETLVMTSATVMVAGLIGQADPADPVAFPEGYDANLGPVINSYPFMMAALHNVAHNRPGPFIATFEKGARRILDEADRGFMRVDTPHRVVFGKNRDIVWVDIDGQRVVTAPVQPGLESARLMLRIRGTGFREAAAIFRNVEIKHCPASQTGQGN